MKDYSKSVARSPLKGDKFVHTRETYSWLNLSEKKTIPRKRTMIIRDNEVDLVLQYMNGVEVYLEWGTGGSTMYLPMFASRRAYAIEHHESWCSKMKNSIRKDVHLSLIHI